MSRRKLKQSDQRKRAKTGKLSKLYLFLSVTSPCELSSPSWWKSEYHKGRVEIVTKWPEEKDRQTLQIVSHYRNGLPKLSSLTRWPNIVSITIHYKYITLYTFSLHLYNIVQVNLTYVLSTLFSCTLQLKSTEPNCRIFWNQEIHHHSSQPDQTVYVMFSAEVLWCLQLSCNLQQLIPQLFGAVQALWPNILFDCERRARKLTQYTFPTIFLHFRCSGGTMSCTKSQIVPITCLRCTRKNHTHKYLVIFLAKKKWQKVKYFGWHELQVLYVKSCLYVCFYWWRNVLIWKTYLH